MFINIFIVETCLPLLDSLGNGTVIYSSNSINGRYLLGVEVYFSCNPGYTYAGFSIRYCFRGNWDGFPTYTQGHIADTGNFPQCLG